MKFVVKLKKDTKTKQSFFSLKASFPKEKTEDETELLQ